MRRCRLRSILAPRLHLVWVVRLLDLASTAANVAVRDLLEPRCAACDSVLERPLAGPVCEPCWRAVPRLSPPCCARCGDALASSRDEDDVCPRCRTRPLIVGLARSAGRYDGSLRQIVHAFKYGRRRVLARRLAALMREAGGDVLHDADALVPVPLSFRRGIARGFNQADDLARHLGPPVRRVLHRTRHGPPQAGLPAARRRANVQGAYAVRPFTRPLRGLTLVLIDDVMTTGETMEACGQALVGAGAASVRALTVARAVARR